MPGKYRIGLLVDGISAPRWVRDLARWASDHPAIELAAIIVSPVARITALERLFRLERRLFCGGEQYRNHAKECTIGDCAPVTIFLESNMLESAPQRLAEVRGLKLDALVHCGAARPGSGIPGAARDGVISIVAAPDPHGAGANAGFAEVLDAVPDTRFTIERQKSEGEPREILFEGSTATALLYSWNLISLHARALPYLERALDQLASGSLAPVSTAAPRLAEPGSAPVLSYALRTAGRSLRKAVRRTLRKEFNWQVAFARQGWGELDFSQGKILEAPRNSFLADPFTISVEGNQYLFVEEFPFDTRKGVISAYRIDGDEPRRIGVVLEEPFHLSFPYLFRYKGEIYMVPESGAGRAINLYRSTSFPGGWVKEKVLMADVAAVDTIIFEHDTLWWMFTTIEGEGPALNNAELYAFYATDPLGEWLPHKRNPILMDASKGRNGGFLRDSAGNPYRVAQVPGFTFYGEASAIYRIDELSPESYSEALVRTIAPDFFPGLDGTHHVHSSDGLTVYDFVRVERAGRRTGPFGVRPDEWFRSTRVKKAEAPKRHCPV